MGVTTKEPSGDTMTVRPSTIIRTRVYRASWTPALDDALTRCRHQQRALYNRTINAVAPQGGAVPAAMKSPHHPDGLYGQLTDWRRETDWIADIAVALARPALAQAREALQGHEAAVRARCARLPRRDRAVEPVDERASGLGPRGVGCAQRAREARAHGPSSTAQREHLARRTRRGRFADSALPAKEARRTLRGELEHAAKAGRCPHAAAAGARRLPGAGTEWTPRGIETAPPPGCASATDEEDGAGSTSTSPCASMSRRETTAPRPSSPAPTWDAPTP